MKEVRYESFAKSDDLFTWLEEHHKTTAELWVQIFKKASGRSSVSWNDCVIEAIAWGWIDGLKKSLDESSYLQRLTPRKPKSSWSKRNKDHAERLILEGRMQPPGLLHVEEAKKDGRWEAAYEGSAGMSIPDDFLRTLKGNRTAQAFFKTLDRKNLYAIYHRLATA